MNRRNYFFWAGCGCRATDACSLTAACYFNFATATAIAAARLIPLPCAQLSKRSSTAGSIVTVITIFFPVRLIDFLPSGA